jgi:ATP-binding cassette subfamily B protein
LTSVTPITYAYNVYYRWSRRLNRTIWAAVSDATEVATEAFSNFRTVRAFGAEDIEIRRFNQATGLASKAATTAAYIGATVKVYSRYVDSAATVLVLWYGGNQAFTKDSGVTLGVLIAFQLYWNILNNAFNSLSGVVGDLISASSAAERVYSLMDARPAVDPNAGREIPPEELKFDLKVDNVDFHYKTRPGNQVLKGVCLEIPAGKVTALVGRSGSGKSTLMHLLLRLYDPTSGQILLSGAPLTELKISSIRSSIGLVAQDTQLFAQSIFKNITYGLDREVSMGEVIEAAKAANAHEFIMEMDEGYETKIGEKGVLLSGGQRQRIAIARCFLRKPRLLLLDEATSALDAENESLVQAAIDKLISRGEATVVLIAHRLSTVMNANNIAVMNRGTIVEQETHNQLTSNPQGVYSQLVSRQRTMETDRLHQQEGPATVDKLFDALEKQ